MGLETEAVKEADNEGEISRRKHNGTTPHKWVCIDIKASDGLLSVH